MKWEAAVRCPAKINLHLEVGPGRPDGFHDVLSLFQMVDLCDILWIRSLKKSDFCSISGDFDFPQEENIIYKAVRRFTESVRLTKGFTVHVDKVIPAGAGLGGGSSDAAGILRVLNKMYGDILSRKDLLDLGAELGSDVPFFLTSPAAVVSGRGEIVDPLPPRYGLGCLLADTGIKINTAEAYSWVDEAFRLQPPSGTEDIVHVYTGSGPEKWKFRNTFEAPVFRRFGLLQRVKEQMELSGALHAGLSGSGSAVYGIYPDGNAASQAAEGLNIPGVAFKAVKMLARLPAAILQ